MLDLGKAKASISSLPQGDLDYHLTVDRIKKGTHDQVQQHLRAIAEMACQFPDAVKTIEALQSALLGYEVARQSMCVGDRRTAEEIEAEARAVLHDRGLL